MRLYKNTDKENDTWVTYSTLAYENKFPEYFIQYPDRTLAPDGFNIYNGYSTSSDMENIPYKKPFKQDWGLWLERSPYASHDTDNNEHLTYLFHPNGTMFAKDYRKNKWEYPIGMVRCIDAGITETPEAVDIKRGHSQEGMISFNVRSKFKYTQETGYTFIPYVFIGAPYAWAYANILYDRDPSEIRITVYNISEDSTISQGTFVHWFVLLNTSGKIYNLSLDASS